MAIQERIRLLPRYYLVVSGIGLSRASPINAFDKALRDAGIHDLNLVEVSSILPRDVEELKFRSREELQAYFKPGEIIHVVMAKRLSSGGECIAAGLMWGEGLNSHGYVIEQTLTAPENEDLETLKKKLLEKLKTCFREGIEIRGITIKEERHRIAAAKIPEKTYGCAITALILC
ncbi:pyruvoyl-dependent arginine decarboxylase [Candidatus Bathyarchaeota archaeon]|nr:pyruvoyl-dependent arginine decarboxylase [Candidatus Bathyarchaeota archaeon]